MKLSVITINFNNEEGLKKTLKSIADQTYKEFEFIIIDGASTDNSINIIKEYEHIISFWVSEPDNGIYNAMNKGIKYAHGEYCIFMNSGDIFYDKYSIEKSIPHLNNTTVVCGKTKIHDKIIASPFDVTLATFIKYSFIHQSSFIKTSIQKQYLYDENYKIASDWKFYIQILILNNETYKAIDTIISEYDLTGISTTNSQLKDRERHEILQFFFPKRILTDYINSTTEIDYNLYMQLRQSKYRNYFYTLIIIILKFISLFTKSTTWIRNYPLKIKQ